MLEKTLESPMDCKEIQPVHPKGDQSWVFIGRTDVEAETPVLWPPDRRADSFEKTLMLGKIEGRRRGQQRMRWLGSITNSMDMGLSKIWETVEDREAWHFAVQGTLKSLFLHHSSKASILRRSAFFTVQLTRTSIHDYWKNHSLD